MALPATEPFTGTGALSGSWTQVRGSNSRASDQGRGDNALVYNNARWNADTFNNDQYAQVVSASETSGGYHGPTVRSSGTNAGADENWYTININSTDDNDLLKCVNTTITTVANNLFTGIVNGDTLRLEAEGTSLRVYVNGTQVGTTQTDSSLASGSGGFLCFHSTSRVDNFEAGNLGAAVGHPMMRRWGGVPGMNQLTGRGGW